MNISKKRIKVGIITFHCSYNYGSALQAYALQEYISALGYDVKIINYVDKLNFGQYKLFRQNMYKKYPRTFISDIAYLFPHIKRKRSFERFSKQFFNLTSKKYFDVCEMKELNDELDVFVCGSDQIWNLDCTKGVNPAYFLAFVNADKKKIAYAPSLAHNNFDEKYLQNFDTYLKRLNCISVREHSAVPYLKKIVKKDVYDVLDPTLLLTDEAYSKVLLPISDQGSYIFVYMIENDEKMVDFCHRFANYKNIKICYVSINCKCGIRGKNLYGISPGEFLSFIKKARYIITNSFHATVFSVLFEKKFCTFPTSKSSSRMCDFLTHIELDERLDSETLENEINYEDVKGRLEDLKSKSVIYLTESLRR